jgi:dTDP-4-amino-4,6-dideoxygalactose transaminase
VVKIPFVDLKGEMNEVQEQITEAVNRVLTSGEYILGTNVDSFEKEVAEYLDVKYTVGVNSGTDALIIGLKALGIKPQDEVITSPFTFLATVEAISQVGAKPIFADIDPDTYTIRPESIEEKISSKTRGIVPVHLFGQGADMYPILKIAEKYNLKVLEDVAQGFGGEYDGKKLGTLGQAGAFSFYPTKVLGACGDAGLICTDDPEVAERALLLREHGGIKKGASLFLFPGYNSRLSEIQAAILRVKLPLVDNWIVQRRVRANIYHSMLKGFDQVILPKEGKKRYHVYNLYTIRIRQTNRDELVKGLVDLGIGTSVYYKVPIHKMPPYEGTSSSLPCSEQVSGEVLSLPIWPRMTYRMQEEVVQSLASIM